MTLPAADLLDIKAGCCDGSAPTYGSAAHIPHKAIFVGPQHREQFSRGRPVLYTNSHMEGIYVANGQTERDESEERMAAKHHILTKAQLGNDSLFKSLCRPNAANLL